MEKGVWGGAIVVFVVLLGGYVVALPYITITDIKTFAQDRDQEKIAEYINFPVLRENFKQQLSDQMIKSDTDTMQDNHYAALEVIGLASKMADVLVDAFITPAGLTSMMSGQKPGQYGTTENREIFKAAKYSFDDTNSFSAQVKTDDDEEVRFVLTRNGLSWKLTNIIFPLQCDACHENRFKKAKRE